MLGLSPAHLILIALVVLLLFGGGRVSGLMGDVAKGIKSFKKGMQDDEDDKPAPKPAQRIEQSGQTIDQPVETPSEHKREG
ncbi:MAG: twin-arginine translocase TatA/TatE family subunit [Sphingobium sp.]|nr:twin-arginine translocase TatA/TatE family subunit [Sphingobium sp.]